MRQEPSYLFVIEILPLSAYESELRMLVTWWLLYIIVLHQTDVVIIVDEEIEKVSLFAERGCGRQLLSVHDFDGGHLVAAFGLLNVTEPNRYGEYETDVQLCGAHVRMTLQIATSEGLSEIIVRFELFFPVACLAMAEQEMAACMARDEMAECSLN